MDAAVDAAMDSYEAALSRLLVEADELRMATSQTLRGKRWRCGGGQAPAWTRGRRGGRCGGAEAAAEEAPGSVGRLGGCVGVGLNFGLLLYVAQHANEKNRSQICMLGWSCS